ncbi:unnamed protein product [Prunus armeniaca]
MERVMKVRNWRDASKKAANMAGFDNSNKTGCPEFTKWTFLLNILCLEILSLAFDQASSPSNPQFAFGGARSQG